MKKWLPWILAAAFGAWVLTGFAPAKTGDGYHFDEFGRLPVLLNGRIQPFDSVARNALLMMRGKQTVAKDKTGPHISATEWLLDVMLRPDEADQYLSFRVQHPDVQSLLDVRGSGLEYVSFNQIVPHVEKLEEQVAPILKAEQEKTSTPETRTPYQKDLIHLYESLVLYHRLKNSVEPEDSAEFMSAHVLDKSKDASASGAFVQELNLYQQAIRTGVAAVQETEKGQPHNDKDLQLLVDFFKRYQALDREAHPLIVPPLNPAQSRDDWKNVGRSLLESMKTAEIHPALFYFANMASAYGDSRPAEFNRLVAEYRQWLTDKGLVAEIGKGQHEWLFNHLEPFYKAMVIYVAALLLGCAYWLYLSEWVRRSAFYLLVVAFVVHTLGLGFRMYLEGRPPVTNLYSSAIFVGWGAVLLGIILERIYRDGIGIVASAGVGFTTQIIAHHLALGGDTMEMLRAVLDTNFWLATHVVMITTGYASMFFAGCLAMLYVLRGVFTRSLTETVAKSLSRMVYGIVCFATLFSFVGTILGGIWADQSWGRFWGWDPKENGALLIVLWCAIILHARWGRMVKERGLMALALFGNIVTSFSWFGVNMLGVGLHAYGFMDKAFTWLMIFIASQVVLILLAMLPDRFWLSFRDRATATKPPKTSPSSGRDPGLPAPAHA
jgi:ABC-type transport system involved in cytochrome c biogenesis permease subunit